MLGLRLCSVLVILAALTRIARADDAVALLPLDADQRLEIYGQPVASELARALVAGGVDVVVVGPKMSVPDRAKLVVDGTISASKADLVTFSLRIRNPVDGTTLATAQSTSQGLANIDKAAAELSAKLLPIVKTQLAALQPVAVKIVSPPPDTHVATVAPAAPDPLVFAATTKAPTDEPLRAALAAAAAPWATQHHHEIVPADPKQALGGKLAVSFEVLGYRVAKANGDIPYARARVHVRIAAPGGAPFDRIVVTDSVLGDKGIAPDALAARTAREVLDILRPHLKRLVGAW